MNLLVLDASTRWPAVALQRADGTIRAAPIDPEPRHGRALVPAIRELLAASGLRPQELDTFAVGVGPGSFTGLRIAVTAMKTLAYATRCPLISMDSLELIARNAPEDILRVAVAVDAQRGDLFTADYQRSAPSESLERLGPSTLEPATAWTTRLQPGTLVLTPEPDRLAALLPDSVQLGPAEFGRPDGRKMLERALELWDAGQTVDPWFLEPTYLRRSAAEEKWAESR